MYSLTVLEARSLKSRCWQDHTPSEDSREVSLPLPNLWWLLAIRSVPYLAAASLQSLPCHHMATFFVCVCVCEVCQ